MSDDGLAKPWASGHAVGVACHCLVLVSNIRLLAYMLSHAKNCAMFCFMTPTGMQKVEGLKKFSLAELSPSPSNPGATLA